VRSGLPVLAAGAGAAAGTLFVLMSRGRVHMDLGWGRSFFPLGPIEVTIAAPRDLVFDVIQGAYAERAPAEVRRHIRVLERAGDLVVAEHRTPLRFLDAITVETVRFERPSRVEFVLLRGPVPEVRETFQLREDAGRTTLTYEGTLGADLWVLGRWYGDRVVRPAWDAVVAASLEQVRAQAEAKARSRGRKASKPGPPRP